MSSATGLISDDLTAAAPPSCILCREVSEQPHVIYDDAHWVVRHSTETNILGYLILQAKRHVLDLSAASQAEVMSYGLVLRRTMQAIHEVIEPQRIYTFSIGEAVPHYHLHLVPRTPSLPRAYRARGVMQYPLAPVADESLVKEACNRIKRAMARLGLTYVGNR